MNIAKLALRQWLRMYEASHYLTSKLDCGPYGSENGISERDVLDFALAGCFLLTLDIPPSTTDKRGVELEDGYWDLLMKGSRGKPGRQQVKLQVGPPVSVKGIDGAWVARKIAGERVVRQLRPQAGPGAFSSAFPEGCALGVRTKALNDFVKKQLKGQMPPKVAEQLNKDLDPRERKTYLKLIAALAHEAGIDPFTGPAFAKATDFLGRDGRVGPRAAKEKIDQIYDEAEEEGWHKPLPPRARAKKETK